MSALNLPRSADAALAATALPDYVLDYGKFIWLDPSIRN